MYTKNKFISTISALIFVLMVSVFCVSSMASGATSIDSKTIANQFNVMPDKVWKINFNKEVDLTSINYENVKVYDKATDKAISVSLIVDYSNYRSFTIKPYMNYTKGKGYRIEITNIKTKDGEKTLKPTIMDFYIKNIYAGLPGENGLVIIADKAYSSDYLLTHSKEVNEIILNSSYDIYFTYDANYEQLSSILKYGLLDGTNVTRKYDKMTYIDPKGNNHIYVWNANTQEYKLQSPSVDLQIVVRSDVKLISVTPTNLVGVPGAMYFKLKHSSSIKNIGEIIAYTSSEMNEEISILSSDKTVLAKGYFNIQYNLTTQCSLYTFDDFGAGNTGGNIVNNGIAALDSEGYIYYSNPADKEALYKMAFDGVFNKKISEEKAQYINVSQDYIYYSNYTDGGRLYKSKLDGSQKQLLVDDKAAYITLSGEDIYYSNHSDGGKLYKVKKNGSDAVLNHGNQVIADNNSSNSQVGEVAYINIDGDWIYYINHADGHKPYVINKEGTYRGKLSDEYATSLQVFGDWVYYCSGNGTISKVKKDGTGGVVAIKGKASEINKGFYINVLDEWIYYSNVEDGNKLYKIKTDGSGEKIKLSEDAVGYINIVAGNIYYNTTKGKLFRVALNGNINIKPQEIGSKTTTDNVLNMDSLKVVVAFSDVNQDIKFLEKKYLPEKVSAIMGDNTMKQLVVIWDTVKVTVKDGTRTYKGSAIGYNKIITLDLVLPSEMLNDTNKISIYNNNGKNDSVEVADIDTAASYLSRKIQEGELVRVYSDEAIKYKLGEAKVTRDKIALIPKLDLDAYGKSIWVTITRLGRAESAPTEVKQAEAPLIRDNAAKDIDYANLGVDVRDFTISNWTPSVKNSPLDQYVYIVPSKIILDMKSFQAVDNLNSMRSNSWDGTQLYNKSIGDKLELRKLDSKKTLIKAGNYDVYIATGYSGYGSPDVYGRVPKVEGRVSSDTPSIVTIKEEMLPKKPIMIEQRVQANTEITLAVAPAIGETAWLIPVEDLPQVKGWKWENIDTKEWIEKSGWNSKYNSDGSNPYDPFKALEKQNKDVTKLVGDGMNKFIKAPLGMVDGSEYRDKKYKLFIVNGVGASLEGGASLRDTNDSIVVDNQKSTLELLSNIAVKSGEPIIVKTSENSKMPGESEEARVFIVKDYDSIITIDQLENSVKAGNGKVIKVKNQTSYRIDTTGLEAALDSIKPNYTIVVVDNAGNVSPAYYVNIMLKTDELISLLNEVNEKLASVGTISPDRKDTLSKMNSLTAYLPSVEKIINNTLENKKESQKNITAAYKNLRSKFAYFLNSLGGGTGILTTDLDVDAPRFEYKNPNVGNVSVNSALLNIKVKEAATAYYVVQKADSQAPDQKQLLNYPNIDNSLIVQRGDFTFNIVMSTSISISGLERNTNYIVYTVLVDDQFNYSTVEMTKFITNEK
ncbi:DUF5050 domain-containing protein [Clostridium estertheticum]|uniref:DUF5050 domain-containing protein n=1 Tax=Clostridium estertheticum TaxID=238834 RepID=UPI0013E979EE|nr:DUF5050 domain-containing protein [Clostridium estertheticum]MBZ9688086.1 DUF5050 domain-containing protein [Clostridium estertheticum]